jgi:carbonic anhydrase
MSRQITLRSVAIGAALTVSAVVGVTGSLAATGQPQSRAGAGTAWSYEGATGPANWGSLDPSFAACVDGSVQSPIDIVGATSKAIANPKVAYENSEVIVENNGHTVQANALSGSSITVGGVKSELLQMHFHAPAENMIAGLRAPVDVHFVHRAANGKLTVIGVMLKVGSQPNAGWQPMVRVLRLQNISTASEASEVTTTFDWAAMLPKDRRSFRFAGSLTTPGCTEGVSWIVMKQPVLLSAAQIAAFKGAYDNNARPVQPINGRPITSDSSR